MSTAEPLTDADAEMVLLALGPCLMWETVTRDVWMGHDKTKTIQVENFTYIQHYNIDRMFSAKGVAVFRCSHGPGSPTIGSEQLTFDAAKAACEHHNQTGEWPG